MLVSPMIESQDSAVSYTIPEARMAEALRNLLLELEIADFLVLVLHSLNNLEEIV